MDTGSFITNVKTEDFYEDIGDDVENYEVNRPLSTGKK